MFHAAIRSDPGDFGANEMCAGRTLFVGWPLLAIPAPSPEPEPSSTAAVAAFAAFSLFARFAGRFSDLEPSVSEMSSGEGEGEGSDLRFDAARFGAMASGLKSINDDIARNA